MASRPPLSSAHTPGLEDATRPGLAVESASCLHFDGSLNLLSFKDHLLEGHPPLVPSPGLPAGSSAKPVSLPGAWVFPRQLQHRQGGEMNKIIKPHELKGELIPFCQCWSLLFLGNFKCIDLGLSFVLKQVSFIAIVEGFFALFFSGV